MVKIHITLEGEDVEEIVDDLLAIGISIVESKRKELNKLLTLIADESLDVLLDHKTLEKGAKLYRKINSEINWSYKHDTQK